MSNAENGRGPSGLHEECVQGLQKVHPDYAKVQALAAVSLVEAMQDVSQRRAMLETCGSAGEGCTFPVIA